MKVSTTPRGVSGRDGDRRIGDETLNTMSPPVTEGMGRRTGVEMYEVPINLTA